MCTAVSAGQANTPLTCLQKPIAWVVGQQTRIVVGTPADCGRLEVVGPGETELFDRGHWRQGDTQQAFHFRATAALAGGVIRFSSGEYALELPVQILTWAQAREPRTFEKWPLPRLFPMDRNDSSKQGITFVEQGELERLREAGLEEADQIAAGLPDDEALFYSLPETTIPRAVFVQYQQPKGCPICGRKIFKGRSPFYPWKLDFEGHPWKVGCPECERWFPSNDFANGDMHSGEFPDDGWGCFGEGEKLPYCFIGYYTCWHYINRWVPMTTRLCAQYARSGNRRIGHAAALMLFRTAEQYLNLAVNINQRKSLMRSSVWAGKIIPQTNVRLYNTWLYIEHNWEVPRHTQHCIAFEQLWSFFEEEDAELLAFLQRNGHPEIRTMRDVREFIETGYFRTVAQACLDKNLIGNLPQGQRATIESALFLNTPRSRELVDWVFNKGGMMRYFLTNDYFIDGSAFESQGYNAGHVYNLEEFARVFERIRGLNPGRFEAPAFPSLTADPKYRNLFDFCIAFNLIGRAHAQTGDCGDVAGTGQRSRFLTTDVQPEWFVGPFALAGSTRYARVLWDVGKEQPIPQVTDPELRERITEVITEQGPEIDLPSNVLDGYGHAILRSGKGDDRRALWVRYGRHRGHAHDDMLTIGWEGKMRKLMPELGYPHSWTFRRQWEGNWATHYCGRVVGDPGHRSRGHCRLFADGGWARVATAYAPAHRDAPPPAVYTLMPEVGMERTIALVDLDDADSYAVDILRLRGGTEHYWSFHGPRSEGRPAIAGLELTHQDGGTLAGPEIAYGEGGDWAKQNPQLSAFPYLYDVGRARPAGAWSLDFALEGAADIHLRLTVFSPPGADVSLARGKPPGGGKPYELQWALQHAAVDEAGANQFVSVVEAYEGARRLTNVERLPVRMGDAATLPPVALRVTAGRRVDTIICARSAVACEAGGVRTDGVFAVWSEIEGKFVKAFMTGGTALGKGTAGLKAATAGWRGKITAVRYRERTVAVTPPPPYPEALVGRYARVSNAGSDCTHLITGATTTDGHCELTFELDPRICEGPVTATRDNAVTSGVTLQLAGLRYCHGKTLTNEDGSVAFRVSGVTGRTTVWIDPEEHGAVPAEQVQRAFHDPDGDGSRRFLVYDYGVGDEVAVPTAVSLRNASETQWRLETPVDVEVTLPGQTPVTVAPGRRAEAGGVTVLGVAGRERSEAGGDRGRR